MTVAAILLAAGKSRRMGTSKQLLPLGDTTVIGCCLESLWTGGVGDIIVVVSPEGAEVAEEARRFPVRIVVNEEPGGDMSSSVRSGRDNLPSDCSSVLIALSDCPLVQPSSVQALLSAGAGKLSSIVIPVYEGRRGHPVLFPRTILGELTDDLTLRDLVRKDPGRVAELPIDDSGVLLDMDTPVDYQRLKLRNLSACGGVIHVPE